MTWQLHEGDLRFLLGDQAAGDPDRIAMVDEAWLDNILEDDALFDRLIGDDLHLLGVSPWLFFSILLRRAKRDLVSEAFTMERRANQKVIIFDTDQVVELLDQEVIRDYLATLLASFTRIASMTVRVNVGRGVWRRYRTNDLDVEGLMRYAEAVDEPLRFEPYKRIGDVCLFMVGMFSEAIETKYRYAASRQIRPGARGHLLQSREDYERYGRAFYQMAAEHRRAEVGGLDAVLSKLSDDFILAEKPLAFLADRYLWTTRHQIFKL